MPIGLIDILASGVTDDSGNIVASGTVTFYQAGTSTLETVYQDYELSSAHANPATLDSAGRLVAYSDTRIKVVIRKSDGTTVRTIDDVNLANSDLTSATASDLAGSGLTASGDQLHVNVDGTTLEIESDTVMIRDKVVQSKTTTYTVVHTDDVVICDTSGGAWTLTLPAASTMTRRELTIRRLRTDTSANLLTIDGNASETIDGLATIALNVQGWVRIVSDGSNWQVLNHYYGYQVSSADSGSFTTTSASLVDVTNLSLAIATNGRRVRLSLLGNGGTSESYVSIRDGGTNTNNIPGYLSFDRGGTQISKQQINVSNVTASANNGSGVSFPPGAFVFTEIPTAGTYTYKARANVAATDYTLGVQDCLLFAEVI